ncbi:hypothetical protein [Streptomyces sp. NPDC059649]|uniref:hypothetical protein n=1 Tax=Streptomyces sp. NPDC059649 TaxID=3346895 RepID=UPI0036ADC63E
MPAGDRERAGEVEAVRREESVYAHTAFVEHDADVGPSCEQRQAGQDSPEADETMVDVEVQLHRFDGAEHIGDEGVPAGGEISAVADALDAPHGELEGGLVDDLMPLKALPLTEPTSSPVAPVCEPLRDQSTSR